jgi:hypothetical protein
MHWLLPAIALMLGCVRPDLSVTGDDHAVYAAALDSLYGSSATSGATRAVVLDSTSTYLRAKLVPGIIEGFLRLPGVDSATIRSFEARNRVARSLAGLRPEGLRIQVTLAPRSAFDSMPRTANAESYWEAVRALYPGLYGLVDVSSVGYNRERTVAIVKIHHGCGSTCGAAHNVVLRRVGTEWRVSAAEMTVVY